MSAVSIRSELDSLGVSYSDCFEKVDLVKRLSDARSGSLDRIFYEKKKKERTMDSSRASTSSSSSSSPHSSSSSQGASVETVVIEPDEVMVVIR